MQLWLNMVRFHYGAVNNIEFPMINNEIIEIIQNDPWIVFLLKDVNLSKKGRSLRYKNKTYELSANGIRIYSENLSDDLICFSVYQNNGRKTFSFYIVRNSKSKDIVKTLNIEKTQQLIKLCKSEDIEKIINFI